jgi:hypothetical protein
VTQADRRFVRCVVPFCEGGYQVDPDTSGSEAICGDHWRLVDKRLKAVRTHRRREAERDEVGGPTPEDVDAHYWPQMCRQAIERAAGIS